MPLQLHNTLTQRVERLKPLVPGKIGMYACGPTVYNYVHIGNFRTFVFQDLLRRYLRYKGFELTHVMNITDVEDKIIASARVEGVSIHEYTGRYTEAFMEDLEKFRIQKPEIMPRATEHINVMVDLIRKLNDQGYTYQSEGSTYYDISRFPEYGKLSGLDLSETQLNGRIDADEYSKENPRDFVLWKAKKPGEAYWQTPLGPGRPGWHIECSAMSMKYLGETFDIHCGGVDLVFPHHENEIAQSEAAMGKPFVRHWIHSAHLVVDGEKMAKSKGNFYTPRDLLGRGYYPTAIRYLLQSVHYRKQLNFSLDGIKQAQAAVQRVNDFLRRLHDVPAHRLANPELAARTNKARDDFESSMDDDLNTSAALAVIFELIKATNPLLDRGEVGSVNRDALLGLFADINQVFAVFGSEDNKRIDEDILRLIDERALARRNREYQRADEIRDLLVSRGIILEDTKDGIRWRKVD